MKIPKNYQTLPPRNFLRLQKSRRRQVHQEKSLAIRRWVEVWEDAKCTYLLQQKVPRLSLTQLKHLSTGHFYWSNSKVCRMTLKTCFVQIVYWNLWSIRKFYSMYVDHVGVECLPLQMLTFTHIGLSTHWHYHTKADAYKVRLLLNWNRESLASVGLWHGHIGPCAPASIC